MSSNLISKLSHCKVPKQISMAALAGIYNTSPEDILRQIQAFEIPPISTRAPGTFDVQTVLRCLGHAKEEDHELPEPFWPIVSDTILSRIIGLPIEVLSMPEFLSRLPSRHVVGTVSTWSGPQLEKAIVGDKCWASQRDLRRCFGLTMAQLGWLTIRGILPLQHLDGGAMPGWPIEIEDTRILKRINQLRNAGTIQELVDGELLTLDDIWASHGISAKEMLDFMLSDKISCPLWDAHGNAGWPHDYVQWITDNVSSLS